MRLRMRSAAHPMAIQRGGKKPPGVSAAGAKRVIILGMLSCLPQNTLRSAPTAAGKKNAINGGVFPAVTATTNSIRNTVWFSATTGLYSRLIPVNESKLRLLISFIYTTESWWAALRHHDLKYARFYLVIDMNRHSFFSACASSLDIRSQTGDLKLLPTSLSGISIWAFCLSFGMPAISAKASTILTCNGSESVMCFLTSFEPLVRAVGETHFRKRLM